MTADLGMLIITGVLVASGVYLLLERSITKMLLGLLLFGNGVNLLLLTVGGPAGHHPSWAATMPSTRRWQILWPRR